MRRLTLNLLIAILTFTIGIAVAFMSLGYRPSSVAQKASHTTTPNQSSDHNVDTPNSGLKHANTNSPNPFEIKRYADEHRSLDVKALWQSLGIDATLQTVYPLLGIEVAGDRLIFDECKSCVAEVYSLNLDNEPGKEVLLKVYQSWGYCRFLIFKQVNQKEAPAWKLLGHADHDFARHYMPEHRVEILGKKRFLVVKAQGISGTGVRLAYDRWYEVDSSGVREILSLPAEGHECFNAQTICREFESRVTSRINGQGVDKIQANFTVNYSGNSYLLDKQSDTNLHLLTRRQKAVFTKASEGYAYTLDVQQSSITQEEIRTVYNVDTLSKEDFLRFNIDYLARGFARKSKRYKEYMRRYFEDCQATPEKAKLLQVLEQ